MSSLLDVNVIDTAAKQGVRDKTVTIAFVSFCMLVSSVRKAAQVNRPVLLGQCCVDPEAHGHLPAKGSKPPQDWPAHLNLPPDGEPGPWFASFLDPERGPRHLGESRRGLGNTWE